MTGGDVNPEGHCPSPGDMHWNQSYYFNAYDPEREIGCIIRVGVQETLSQSMVWLVVLEKGKPIFVRSDSHLPYTDKRPANGLEISGLNITVVKPMQTLRITLATERFSFDLTWDEILPMQDAIQLSKTGKEDAFARQMASMHFEGTCAVTGTITTDYCDVLEFDGKGFRDIAIGPRNWSQMQYHRLAWPIFDNGLAICAVHGASVGGHDAYIRMIGDQNGWRGVTNIVDDNEYESDGMTLRSMQWSVTDDTGNTYDFTGRPFFRWFFPIDGYVVVEHMVEYQLADGTKGYGLGECGFRLPLTT